MTEIQESGGVVRALINCRRPTGEFPMSLKHLLSGIAIAATLTTAGLVLRISQMFHPWLG
jgi:hypothetical protein